VHLALRCDDCVQRNARMPRRLRVIGDIEIGRKISLDQQLDHGATSRIAWRQPNTLHEPLACEITSRLTPPPVRLYEPAP